MPSERANAALIPSESLKKNVAAIHTSGDLSLLERKLSNVLLLNAYEYLVTKRTHKIPVSILCAMLGYDSNDIATLKRTLKTLASTTIEFNMMEDGKESWQVMTMISFGEIKNGVCTYRYDEALAERLYDPEIYATINMAVQRQFDSGYALTLYENCIRYKTVGSTGWWEIDKFRRIMGATAPMYDEFKYLRRDVIIKPLEQVNRVSDIRIEADFERHSRRVTKVRFRMADTPQQSLMKPEVIDQYAELREHPTFVKLQDHGIGERLALAWVAQDEELARSVIEYVEDKDRKKLVKGSTGGYIRKLIEEGATVGKPAYQTKKERAEEAKVVVDRNTRATERRKELEEQFLRERTTAFIKGLSLDEKRAHAARYLEELGGRQGTTYQADKADFIDSIERVKFTTWLRMLVSKREIDVEEFKVWAKGKKQEMAGE